MPVLSPAWAIELVHCRDDPLSAFLVPTGRQYEPAWYEGDDISRHTVTMTHSSSAFKYDKRLGRDAI
jgi:hypothetical protein